MMAWIDNMNRKEYCEDCLFFKQCDSKKYICPAGKAMLRYNNKFKTALEELTIEGKIKKVRDGNKIKYKINCVESNDIMFV